MHRFNSNSAIKDVLDDKTLKDYSEYFYYRFPEEIINKRIDETSWYAREAINWFYDKSIEGKTSIWHFDKRFKNVNLIQITQQSHAKMALIVSGGGFTCIDTAHEGIAIGKELFEQGYDVFLLTYRLGKEAKFNNTTIDINNAVSFINANQNKLNVDVQDFILIGGSAGAYLAASYCSNNRGYIKHNNPKPKCLCLLYPIVDFHLPEPYIKQIVVGEKPSKYLIDKYSVVNHVKDTFPPTFIAHSEDDDCVSVLQSEQLNTALQKNGIMSKLCLFKTGKHGWSIAKNLEPETWFSLFIKFIKNL